MRFLFAATLILWIAGCQPSSQTPAAEAAAPATPAAMEPARWSASDRALTPLLNAYFDVKDALVEWDSAGADAAATRVKALGDSLSADTSLLSASLRTHVSSVAAETAGFLAEEDITEKRRAFHMMSQHLLPLLKEASYGAQTVYQQVCPMAFNDNETAYWLSNDREIVNPYLGKKHPKYASGMLHCGELSDSLTVRP
jgi:hypothetical protein